LKLIHFSLHSKYKISTQDDPIISQMHEGEEFLWFKIEMLLINNLRLTIKLFMNSKKIILFLGMYQT